LFGFDRIHELLARHLSAARIADAAQPFRRIDDICVLQVELLGAAAPAVA
jgi:hypothetical protein